MAKIKKDDLVQVISGKDKGKQGKVLRVFPADERVLVEGVNRVTKHLRAGQDNNGSTEGGLQVVEAPIHISNVMLFNPASGKGERVGYKVLEDGRKVRVFRSSGEAVDA